MAAAKDGATIRAEISLIARTTRAGVEALQKLAAEKGVTLEQLLADECQRACEALARKAMRKK